MCASSTVNSSRNVQTDTRCGNVVCTFIQLTAHLRRLCVQTRLEGSNYKVTCMH